MKARRRHTLWHVGAMAFFSLSGAKHCPSICGIMPQMFGCIALASCRTLCTLDRFLIISTAISPLTKEWLPHKIKQAPWACKFAPTAARKGSKFAQIGYAPKERLPRRRHAWGVRSEDAPFRPPRPEKPGSGSGVLNPSASNSKFGAGIY